LPKKTWFVRAGFARSNFTNPIDIETPMYSDPLIQSSTETPRSWRSYPVVGVLLGTCVASLLVVAMIDNKSPKANSLAVKCRQAYPPLNGITQSQWASPYQNAKENLEFAGNAIIVDWSANGSYVWWAPEVVGRTQDHGVEQGIGLLLEGPIYSISTDEYKWTSRAFTASHVPSANHTSCCCQFMQGSGDIFWLTEYCRALVPGRTEALEQVCAPYMSPACPSDNATASKMAWPIPMYNEVYGKCYIEDIQSKMA